MKKYLRLFTRCDSGVALIEFGIVFPFLILMLVGMIEVGRYAIIIQKLDKTTNAMADYVTQGTEVCTSDLGVYAQAASDVMAPFSFSGTIIFSSVVAGMNAPPCTSDQPSCISWQSTPVGGNPSQIGNTGGPAALGGYTLPAGQNLIVAEVFYNYTPEIDYTSIILPALQAQTLYRIAIYKPRQGALTSLCDS